MACCVIALAMVYRLIDSYRRGRAWLARVPATARGVWHAPRFRAALALAACVELAAAGGLTYQHRQHLGDLGARALYATTGLGADLCRSLSPVIAEN